MVVPHKIAVISKEELDVSDFPGWLRAAEFR